MPTALSRRKKRFFFLNATGRAKQFCRCNTLVKQSMDSVSGVSTLYRMTLKIPALDTMLLKNIDRNFAVHDIITKNTSIY